MSQVFKAIQITKFGQPLKVLKLIRGELNPKLSGKQIFLKHLAAPINPADISMIHGGYGYKPILPTVAGLEGCARVMAVGPSAQRLQLDDVVVFVGSTGSWQTHSIVDEDNLFKVDKNLHPFISAQIKVNPCTAYRLLKDFVEMKTGDCFMQNGANSAVGVYAIQLAKRWGLKSINVIRDRPNLSEVVEELESFGADHVITETQLQQPEFMENLFKKIPQPRLVLDCVFGQNVVDCMRYAGENARCVTYGAMSRKPLGAVSPSSFIFKGHSYSGFWMTKWYDEKLKNDRRAVDDMIGEVCFLFSKKELKLKAHQVIKLEEYEEAIQLLSQGFVNKKFILDLS